MTPWTSRHEATLTSAEHDYISSLETQDQVIGTLAHQKYGPQTIPGKKFLQRIVLKLLFTYQQSAFSKSHLTKRIAQKLEFALRSRRLVGSGFSIGDTQFETHSLSDSNIRQKLEQSTADFWVIYREHSAVLHQIKDQLEHVLQLSSQKPNHDLYVGDNFDGEGRLHRCPQVNKILLRQVDVLGPVFAVSVKTLRESCNGLDPAIWPLACGLHVSDSMIYKIPAPIGIGKRLSIPTETTANDELLLVKDELRRSKINARVEINNKGRQVHYVVKRSPLISIVIPTKGGVVDEISYLESLICDIFQKSTYGNFEVILVADEETPARVVENIDALGEERITWVRYAKPFNFSDKINSGASVSRGEYLLLLNDDLEIVSPAWLENLLALQLANGIGATGALLFFPDQKIQHAGHFYRGGAGHVGYGEYFYPKNNVQLYDVDKVVDGVTAACLLVEKETFTRVGGFSTLFPNNYNDVDFCLKLREQGLQIAISGATRLYHFESISRNPTVKNSEIDLLNSRWRRKLISSNSNE